MRLVLAEDDLEDAVTAARREALASFGDGTVFAERWLAAPRHIEIQVVADRQGHILHLGERECSIQRRHQKLIEESPSPAVDPFLRDQLGAAAVSLAEAIQYDNVGTVEFLLDAEHGSYFFLEMNTRLQVEHRVTEEVTGFDLVELQLRAAMGQAFDFEQDEVDIEGHAIEARLVAEDPADEWLPSTGTVHRFWTGRDPQVRWDAGVADGSVVSPHYDSLLAKVIATGDTRDEATGRLTRALVDSAIHGVRTNRDYLVAVLESEDFVEGNTSTAFVDLHLTLLDAGPGSATLDAHLLAATLEAQRRRRAADRHWPGAPSGWRNVRAQRQRATYRVGDDEYNVDYEIEGASFTATTGDVDFSGRILTGAENEPGGIRLEIEGIAMEFAVHEADETIYVNSAAGQTEFVRLPRFPSVASAAVAGGLVAPVPGRVISVDVAPGDLVTAGQTLMVMEAMKVEHRVSAPADGKVIEVLVAAGDNVDAHQVLVQMDPV